MSKRQPARGARGRPSAAGGGIPWMSLAALLVGAVVIGGLAYVVIQAFTGSESASSAAEKAELDDSPDLPGQYFPPQGRAHMARGTVRPVCEEGATDTSNCYNSNPPTSGPHDPIALDWGVYTSPQPKERAVHNMEHGGVIIWYNCVSDRCKNEIVPELNRLMDEFERDRRLMVMMPYPDMEPDTVAVTAWTRLDKFSIDQFDPDRIRRFVEKHERRFNPEGMGPL